MQADDIRRAIDVWKVCNSSLQILILIKMYKVLKKKLRRWWVKPHITLELRNQFGFYSTLFTHFRMNDEEEFKRLTRMSIPQFNNLIDLVRPHLEKQTVIRTPLCPELRLAVTLQ